MPVRSSWAAGGTITSKLLRLNSRQCSANTDLAQRQAPVSAAIMIRVRPLAGICQLAVSLSYTETKIDMKGYKTLTQCSSNRVVCFKLGPGQDSEPGLRRCYGPGRPGRPSLSGWAGADGPPDGKMITSKPELLGYIPSISMNGLRFRWAMASHGLYHRPGDCQCAYLYPGQLFDSTRTTGFRTFGIYLV